MENEDWGPWIEHDGNGCPLAIGTVVEAEEGLLPNKVHVHTRIGMVTETSKTPGNPPDFYNVWHWNEISPEDYGQNLLVLRYRIRKPRGMAMLDKVLADLDAPTPRKELVDA